MGCETQNSYGHLYALLRISPSAKLHHVGHVVEQMATTDALPHNRMGNDRHSARQCSTGYATVCLPSGSDLRAAALKPLLHTLRQRRSLALRPSTHLADALNRVHGWELIAARRSGGPLWSLHVVG